MSKNISADIEGIIRELNISESDILYPFYEGVINSIQAIDERFGSSDKGTVNVYIERDDTEKALFEQYSQYPIKSIRIVDNGIGFTTENYESFGKAHSTKKAHLGGKGIGRFAMLSIFNSIEIKSITKGEVNNNLISFTLTRKDGLSDLTLTETTDSLSTEIVLSGLKTTFKAETAKYSHENIADNILSHCLLYYLNQTAPVIKIWEDETPIDLSKQYSPLDFVKYTYAEKLRTHDFKLYFVQNDKLTAHKCCLCGHNRKVKETKIETIFPLFSSKLTEADTSYFIQIYVVSTYLDSIVNMSRNEFKFPKVSNTETDEETISGLEEYKQITEKEIYKIIINAITEKYAGIIEERKSTVKDKVFTYLASDDGLEYRHLNPDDTFLETIPDDIDEKKLDDYLHTLQYQKNKEMRKKRDKLFKRDYSNRADYQKLLKEVVDGTTSEGMSRLAQYVSHRKTILILLERYLAWSEQNENYEDESVLHNLIYTMGGNQDTIPYDKHNLWLLDDRLAFHRYIYSDKQIKSHKPIEGKTDSVKETDLAIYDVPFVYGEKSEYGEINSVVVFEFKRPNRNITYDEFNRQMREQVLGIKKGTLKDYLQRHVQTSNGTPIFFYYVCDVNAYEHIKENATTIDGFFETPYKSLMRLTNNVHQEIITYQSLIVNAKRRNTILFKNLGID